jgi:nuclear pore complex protein Nup93
MSSTNPGSLFGAGGLGAATQPTSSASAVNSTSLFGTPSTTQAAPNASLFGNQPPTQQQPLQSLIFGQDQAQMSLGQSSRPSGQTTQPAFFNSLLERGKKRPIASVGQGSNFEDLPSLQLGLDDIRRKARELGSRGLSDRLHPGSTSKA